MTFTIKVRGAASQTMVACYMCPHHGLFDATVTRSKNGDPPDTVCCPVDEECRGCGGQPNAPGVPDCKVCDGAAHAVCGEPSPWTPSPDIACRVKRFEVVRGKWEKPEKPTYLDTRKLGEGQSWDEFKKERAKVWEEKRWREVKEML